VSWSGLCGCHAASTAFRSDQLVQRGVGDGARWRGDAGGLPTLPGSLPRHGHGAWPRRAHRVGRGDAMTAVIPYPYWCAACPHIAHNLPTVTVISGDLT
jgi:hypothetical protein